MRPHCVRPEAVIAKVQALTQPSTKLGIDADFEEIGGDDNKFAA